MAILCKYNQQYPMRIALTHAQPLTIMRYMRSRTEHKDSSESIEDRELSLLSELDRTPEVSQRALSKRMGIALGLTNIMLRNMTQKGYIRISQAGWQRWIYLLTPEGLLRKIHLMTGYIHRVLVQYKEVRVTLREQLLPFNFHSESRVAIFGTGEFAELVYLGLREFQIEEIDILDETSKQGSRFLGIPVLGIASVSLDQYDKIMLGSLGSAEDIYELLRDHGADSQQLVTFFA